MEEMMALQTHAVYNQNQNRKWNKSKTYITFQNILSEYAIAHHKLRQHPPTFEIQISAP